MKLSQAVRIISKENTEIKEAMADYNKVSMDYRVKVDTEILKLKKNNAILAVATILLSGSIFLSAIYDASRDHGKDYYVAKTEAIKEQLDAKVDKRLAKLNWIQ